MTDAEQHKIEAEIAYLEAQTAIGIYL